MREANDNIGGKIRAGIPALTSLRFFAALAVLLFHFGANAAADAGAPHFAVSILRSGYLGVTFFFILSGFILTCAYRDRLGKAGAWKAYWISRLARIYPVYILGLLITLPFPEALRTIPSAQALFLLQSWTLPPSRLGIDWNMPAWTLSIELFFYLLFPIALSLSARLSRPLLLASLLVSAALIASLNLPAIAPYAHQLTGPLRYVPLPVLRLPEFVLGIAMAQLLFSYEERPLPRYADLGAIASATGIVVLMSLPYHAPGLISLGFASLILFATLSQGFVAKALSAPFLVLLGGASYALYLFQMGVHATLDELFKGHETLSRLTFPFAIVSLAVATFIFVEEPLRKYIVRLSRNGLGANTAAPAPETISDNHSS